jgi:ketosteroid isomerase-like protein
MATPDDLRALARRWLACFETGDVKTLVSLYDEHARHTSPKLRTLRPETGGFLIGRAALEDWWADAFRRLPGLRYRERQLTADGERVFMEYVRTVPGEPDLPVAEVLVVRDGRIVESRVYHG